MRKRVALASLIFVALALAVPFAPISAGAATCGDIENCDYNAKANNTFLAPAPCAVACPYWTDDNEATCHPSPLLPEDVFFADWDFKLKIPSSASSTGISFFVFAIESPVVDVDGWMCFREEHPKQPGIYHIDNSANIVGQLCGIVPMVGCQEKNEIVVCNDISWKNEPAGFKFQCIPKNTPVSFRSWNWLEPPAPVPAWVCWSKFGIKPNSSDCAGIPFPGR